MDLSNLLARSLDNAYGVSGSAVHLKLDYAFPYDVVVRFDVARLISRPVTGFHSSRPKKQQLKIKKILIARLVADRRSQVARHVNEHSFSRRSQVASRRSHDTTTLTGLVSDRPTEQLRRASQALTVGHTSGSWGESNPRLMYTPNPKRLPPNPKKLPPDYHHLIIILKSKLMKNNIAGLNDDGLVLDLGVPGMGQTDNIKM
ncbi:hypothetical protein YC2023_059618 [Brassica napus]